MADHTMTVIMSDYIVLGAQNDHYTKVHGAANELCWAYSGSSGRMAVVASIAGLHAWPPWCRVRSCI